MLEAIRVVNPGIRFYQASSSEMFGMVEESPRATTRFIQEAVRRRETVWSLITVNARESSGYTRVQACCSITNPRRGMNSFQRE